MKLRDIIEAERYFHTRDEPRRTKNKVTIKDYLKFVKEVEEFQKFMKEKEKKDEKKPGGPLAHWSVAKKTTFFMLLGPPLGIAYIGCIVLMVKGLAIFVVGK
jgi:hypothetical protein